MRGRTKDQIIAALRQLRGASVEASDTETPNNNQYHTSSTYQPLKLEQFWQYNEPLEPTLVVIAPPPSSDTVLDVLGPIPLPELDAADSKANSEAVMQYLDTVYRQVSQQAVLSAMNVDGG